MRQAVLILVVFAAALLTGCGGGGSSKSSSSTAAASIALSASSLSLNQGDVTTITASVLDSSGAALASPPTVTFASDAPSVATVGSTTGSICAGVWDANFVVCTPGPAGTAKITATTGSLSASTTVYVHKKLDRIVINTPTGICKSVGQTLQLSATAFSGGADVTSTVGPLTWVLKNTSVATVDSGGLLTAHAPGTTDVFATTSNVISVPATYTTCAARSVNVHVSGATDTTFTLASGATQQLAANVVDSAGATITPTLTWTSLQPTVASVNTSGLVTYVGPGTATILAECAINCNIGLPPVYGNAAVATVSGTSATTVYVASTGGTQLIPIDTGTNAAGTAVTLPSQPNSLLFAPNAVRAYLGSSGGLITVDASSNTATQNTALPGKVLAVSPDSNLVLIADTSSVYVQNGTSGGTTDTLAISGATAAAFTPDSGRAYIAAGSTLYMYTPGSSNLATLSQSAAVNDVAVAPSGAFAFLAGGAAHAIAARAICDNSAVNNFPTPGNPTRLAMTPDSAKVLALDSPAIDILTRTSLDQPGCPPPLSATVNSVDLGQGAFTAKQFVLSSSGANAYVASDLPKIIVFDVGAVTASAIPLAGGATGLSESLTLDGAQLYVGGSDNTVHRIDTASGADAQQITVSFTPDLVAVRPK